MSKGGDSGGLVKTYIWVRVEEDVNKKLLPVGVSAESRKIYEIKENFVLGFLCGYFAMHRCGMSGEC